MNAQDSSNETPNGDVALSVKGLASHYGMSQALFDVSFDVKNQSTCGLVGRNGMGKTTTIRCISGLQDISAGSIFFQGQDLTALKPYEIARFGVGLVPEGRRILASLSVEENLVAAALSPKDRSCDWDLDRVYELFPRLKERRGNWGNQLSGGEQQMLAIGRALMLNPRLLILDEAFEGLAPVIRADIWEAIAKLKQNGQTILLVDSAIDRMASLVDSLVIIELGNVVWQGSSDDFKAQAQKLKDNYLSL